MDPIIIKSFVGDVEGSELEGCYFEEVEHSKGEFNFFAPPDKSPIVTDPPSPVRNGIPFTFHHLGLEWTVDFYYSEETATGQGVWSARPDRSGDDPESGTFQAQGGPTAKDLSASASGSK